MNQKQKLMRHWTSSDIIKDKKVINAFKKIKRENFILSEHRNEAYGDYPLPIGEGQTISQPTTVMLMTEALELKEGNKVLEVGTGSGYQAAIISEIIGNKGKVISTEIIPELAEFAKYNIKKSKIKNIEIMNQDGSKGHEKEAPYDRILVAAASPKIPIPLIKQLKEGGIIIIPVGNLLEQTMLKGMKKNNKLIEENLGQFMFVPLKGKHGHG